MRSYCSMGSNVQFGKMRRLLELDGGGGGTNCECP